MRKPKYNALLNKSIQAVLSAIELYNKPTFSYREESFCILMSNAWELLLKAKVLKDNNSKISCLYVPEATNISTKQPRKKMRYKKNRAGNFLTIGLSELIKKEIRDNNLKLQLDILVELRDNAIHFLNRNNAFEKQVLEIATASLKSYKIVVESWFDESLDRYDLFLIPIAFNIPETFSANCSTKEQEKLLQFISQKIQQPDTNSSHDIALVIDIKFSRAQSGILTSYSQNGIPIYSDSEEVFKNKYPISHKELVEKLKLRYVDFKQGKKFNRIKKELQKNQKFYGVRYLDYNNEKGQKKGYYSSDVFKEFDKHYTRKPANCQ
ncbi:DUF3644 domain-containing protein [Campylobacter upsaliensis]